MVLSGSMRIGHRLRSWLAVLPAVAVLLTVAACRRQAPRPPPPVYSYRVVHRMPHDPRAFTQGLLMHEGRLFESTGLYGLSSLREVDLESGRVLRRHDLDGTYFGEGLTVFEGRLIQLTWREGVGFVYDLETFEVLEEFHYPGEGWGLTQDGRHLIRSDGTAELRFLDPRNFSEQFRLTVHDRGRPLEGLNELAFIEGEIWANIFPSDWLARIDPESGQVTGWVDLRGLLTEADRTARRVDVLNGIAYDEANRRLFVTGKLWPWLFEIELVPAPESAPPRAD